MVGAEEVHLHRTTVVVSTATSTDHRALQSVNDNYGVNPLALRDG